MRSRAAADLSRRLHAVLPVLAAACLLLPSSSAAATLMMEPFDYPDGGLVGNGGWAAHSALGSNPVAVSGGRALISQGNGAREDVNRTFASPPSSDKLYACFSLTVTAAPSPGPPVYIAHFRNPDSFDFRSRVYVTSAPGGDYTVGISLSVQTATPIVTWPTPLELGRTYRIVHSYNDENLIAELWVDPVSASSPNIASYGFGLGSVPMGGYALRQGGSSPNEPPHSSSQSIDSIGVATTFAEACGMAVPSDLAISYSCTADTLSGCTSLITTQRSLRALFEVVNLGESPVAQWTMDIDLVNESTGDTIPVKRLHFGEPLSVFGRYSGSWPVPAFDESDKGQWRMVTRVAVQDSAHPEPPELSGNNQSEWTFQVRNPVSDLNLQFGCPMDSAATYCADRLFPGRPWKVRFGVYNLGDVPIVDWSYDITLVNLGTNERTPLQTQAPGDSLPLGGYVQIEWQSPDAFDETQKGSQWQIEVIVAVHDTAHPEPPERLYDNQSLWHFRIENPIPDIAVNGCVTDSAGQYCAYRVFPGRPWFVNFQVYNQGERPVAQWSYDVVLVELSSGQRTTVLTQVPGGSLDVGGNARVTVAVPHPFDASAKGTQWLVEMHVSVKDSGAVEPPERLYNNTSVWNFEVQSPITDIALGFMCVTDSLGYFGCRDRLRVGQPWTVRFDVYNQGEAPLDQWSYDIVLVELGSGERTPLLTQAPGPHLLPGHFAPVLWNSTYPFDTSHKGDWLVEVTAAITDSAHPESPDRLTNNRATWTMRVENPVADIGVGYVCLSRVEYNCVNRIFPGEPWNLVFDVYNAGERQIGLWSFDIDLVRSGTGQRIPLKSRVEVDSITIGTTRRVHWPSFYLFDQSQIDSSWRVEIRVAVRDTGSPEPPERQGNNLWAIDFRVENPVNDIAMSFKCVTDTTPYGACLNRVFPGQALNLRFDVYNGGDLPIMEWGYVLDLVEVATGDRIPLATEVVRDSIAVSTYRQMFVTSPLVFEESQVGTEWRVEATVSVRDSSDPEPPSRQTNNQGSWQFVVDNRVSDIGLAYVCLSDSLAGCNNRAFPTEPWYVTFWAYNKGDRPLAHWGYNLVLAHQGTGDTIRLATEERRDTIPVGQGVYVIWPSKRLFDPSEVGTTWELRVDVSVLDSTSLEPPGRRFNNFASSTFSVLEAHTSIAMAFKCVTDSSAINCLNRIAPEQPWNVSFAVYNFGERPIEDWSYDIDLIRLADSLGTGDSIRLVSQASGGPLAVRGYAQVNWQSPTTFSEAQKGSRWRAVVRVAVTDTSHPEPPILQYDNWAWWEFSVENAVTDLALPFVCTTDSFGYYCSNSVEPGQPWYVVFDVYNTGDLPTRNWSYEIVMIDQLTGDRVPLATVPGDSLLGYGRVRWPSNHLFDEGQLGTAWAVEVTVAVTDSANPEPPDRLGNNRALWAFDIRRAQGLDIAVESACVTDTTRACANTISMHKAWSVLFTVVNEGPVPAFAWTYDVDLVGPDSTVIPLYRAIPGPTLYNVGEIATIHRPSGYVFDDGQVGVWNVVVNVRAIGPDSLSHDNHPENNQRSAGFQVDIPTASLLALFTAEPADLGIELRWQFTDSREITSVELERAESRDGPWSRISAERRGAGGVTVVVDRSVESGRAYSYRLVAMTMRGERLTFGPVTGTTRSAIAKFELTSITPNPSRGASQIRFAVPREARVRLSVMDIQGREVAVLAEGLHRSGSYQALWNGRTARGDAPAGLYFVRYATPAGVQVRRLVMTR